MTKKGGLFKKIFTGLLIVIVVALIAGYIYIRHISTRAIPDYNQNVSLKGIQGKVTIYRDAYAIPHIYAENEADLYRAVGYVMAQDRLWQMDLLRRATTGRLAEIFGEDLVQTDLLIRGLRIPEKSGEVMKRSDPEIIAALEAFADGVNQYMDENMDNLPPEFAILGYDPEKWEIIHSINLIGYMAWDLTTPWTEEFLMDKLSRKLPGEKFKQIIPNAIIHDTPVFPEFSIPMAEATAQLKSLGLGVFFGSNNWAVSGKKSVTGKPILANDMHLGLFAPGIWYQVHMTAGDKLDVTGVAVPGQPFVISGHNRRIAWGMTNVMIDDIDFYVETVNRQNRDQYKFNGEWRDMTVKKEMIKINGGETVEKTLRFTHRGPVVSAFKKEKDRVISVRWLGNEFSNELRSVYLLNRAGNWRDFREAVKSFISLSQNVVYADVDGNIGLQTCAGIPIREGAKEFMVPGDTDTYDWKGLVPFEELPYSYNPESGFVSSANNKTTPDDYPYHISHWFYVPDRIERIREMLNEKEKLSIDDFKRMQTDVKSKHVERYLKDIIDILNQTENLTGPEKESLELLSRWDGVMAKDSAAALIFDTLYLHMVKNLAEDEMGTEFFSKFLGEKTLIRNLTAGVWRTRDAAGWCDDVNTTAKETFRQWIEKSFRDSVKQLVSEMGAEPVKWQWGKRHGLYLNHPMGTVSILDSLFNLNRGPFPVGGSFHTVCPYSYSFRRPYHSTFGASQRHIYSLVDWDESQTVIPTGISGIPASTHYCDQSALYTQNKYHNDFITLPRVEADSRYKMEITGK